MNWSRLPLFALMLIISALMFHLMPDVVVVFLKESTFWVFMLLLSLGLAAWIMSVVTEYWDE